MTTVREPDAESTDALRREYDAATAEVTMLTARRESLERELESLRTAEQAARRALSALGAVTGEAPWQRLGPERLSGARLRDMTARAGLRRGADGVAAHWREWLRWLRADGFDAAGKRAEATFLTQLARIPLVRRAGHDGIYVLDLDLFEERRRELADLHQRIAQLPPPDQLVLVGDGREHRRLLHQEMARLERDVDEMWRVLSSELPPGYIGEVTPARVISAWRVHASGQQALSA